MDCTIATSLKRGALAALASAAASVMVSSVAFAQDASCATYIEATIPKPTVPYRVKQSIKVAGKMMESEAVYINNTIYTRSADSAGGAWIATPLPDLKDAIDMAKKTTSRCSVSGVDTIDGKPMKVWTSFATTPFDPKPSQWKTWIGATDGRVYRQTSEGFEQRIAYDNVTAPQVSDTASPKKRK